MKKRMKYMLVSALSLSMALPVMTTVKPAYAAMPVHKVSNSEELVKKLENVGNRSIIQLDADINVDNENDVLGSITYNCDKYITLDLNGHTISKSKFNAIDDNYHDQLGCLNVENGTLKIVDSNPQKTGTIKLGSDCSGTGYALNISGGNVILDGAKIVCDYTNNGAVIKMIDNGKILIRGEKSVVKSLGGSTELIETHDTTAQARVDIQGGNFDFGTKGTYFTYGTGTNVLNWNIVSGKFTNNPCNSNKYGVHIADGSTSTNGDDLYPVFVKKSDINGGNWKGLNGVETGQLYVYNSKLATAKNKNPIVYELNSKNADNNLMYKTFNNTYYGYEYSYQFEYTNRTSAGTSDVENTFEMYAVPGESYDITKNGTVKLGMYHGYDEAWTKATGTFTGVDSKMTLVLKPLKSSGLGSIIDIDNFRVNENLNDNLYSLNINNALSDSNKLKNATFDDGNKDWESSTGGIEVRNSYVFTQADLNDTNVLEINGLSQDTLVYQSIGTVSKNSKINYSFDVVRRTNVSDLDNTVSVYFVAGDPAQFEKGVLANTVLGTDGQWQTTSAEFNVPSSLENKELFIVFRTNNPASGVGGIVDNVSVMVDSFAPVVEEVTDKTIIVTPIEGATYQLKDKNGKIISENTSGKFTDLTPGTQYEIIISKDEFKPVTYKEVTAKSVYTEDKDPTVPVNVVERTTTSLTIDTICDMKKNHIQEYSIDGGKTWIKGTGNPYTFTGLESGKEYTILTRTAETFTTMPTTPIETIVSTIIASKDVKKPSQPKLTDRTDSTLTFVCGEDEEMSIDGGKTWVKGSKVEFTGLDEGKEYEVLTRKAATADAEASEAITSKAKTAIRIGGTVVGKDLPAEVIITDSVTGDKIATVKTDNDGNWSLCLDEGQYHVEVIGANKEESTEMDIEVSLDEKNDFDAKIVAEKPSQPKLTDRTDNTLTFICGEDEEMSIDGGKTWVKGPKVVFTGLDEGKEYEVLTRKAATDHAEASEAVSLKVKTLIKIGGTVTGKELPAEVVITDPETKEILVKTQTDDKGNWIAYLDQGTYHVEFIGKDKNEEAEKDITVSLEAPRDFDVKMEPVNTSDSTSTGLYAYSMMIAGAAIIMMKKRKEEMM